MIPRTLAIFPRIPLYVAISWVPLSVILLLIGVPTVELPTSSLVSVNESTNSPSATTDYSTQGFTVTVSSSEAVSLRVSRDTIEVLYGALKGASTVLQPDGSFVLRSYSGETLASASATDDIIKVTRSKSDGAIRFVKDEGEFKLKSSDGTSLGRIKLKEEKFNVYSPSGQRLYHGKEKNGSLIVRDEGDSQIGSLTFDSSLPLNERLMTAALLFLPIDLETRTVILVAARARQW